MRMSVLAAAVVVGAALSIVGPSIAVAEEANQAVNPDAATGDKAMDELLAKEKESRKACKIDICSILRGKKAEGADIGCHIVQTWPKKALDKLLVKSHVSWPWNEVQCQTDISLKRATLVSAMTQPKFDAAFDPHTLTCDINRGATADKYTFKISVTPKVVFEDGKATSAQLQWGDVDAPLLAKGVLWPITGLDNKTGMLSGQFIAMVNDFVDKKCDEVKDQLKTN